MSKIPEYMKYRELLRSPKMEGDLTVNNSITFLYDAKFDVSSGGAVVVMPKYGHRNPLPLFFENGNPVVIPVKIKDEFPVLDISHITSRSRIIGDLVGKVSDALFSAVLDNLGSSVIYCDGEVYISSVSDNPFYGRRVCSKPRRRGKSIRDI